MTNQKLFSRDELLNAVRAGYQPEFLFFWSHRPKSRGSTGKECLSQWYSAGFTAGGVDYKTAEHFMMAEKARLFRDQSSWQNIINSDTPDEAKKLGRGVRGFESGLWNQYCFEIVVRGNLHKFSQNPALREYLLSTGQRVLVEASPDDTIWGIGMRETDPGAADPKQWHGSNLLGFALMVVRSQLLENSLTRQQSSF